ncbi:MAG: hypothetical protein GX087_11085 [Desulfobulbaceae bacterium]|nr:hypothetical protein [Desulfobulbaceae bacterium]
MPGNDTYTRVTQTSWFARIGRSFQGLGVGLILLLVATGLMYWNEGRAVRTSNVISEAQRSAVALPGIGTVDPAFNGKLVHASGLASTNNIVSDPLFGVRAQAIRLERKAQYFQWVESSKNETRQKLGGGEETVTTYTYEQKWVDNPVDSSKFQQPEGHQNTINVQADSDKWHAPQVQFGAYRLPEFLVQVIGGSAPLDIGLNEQQQEALQKVLFPNTTSAVGSALPRHRTAVHARDRSPMVHTLGNVLYLGSNMNQPSIGDVKLAYFSVPQAEVSIIAQVNGDSFEPYRVAGGSSFSRLSMGTVGMDNMFQSAVASNSALTWVVRAISILLAIGAFKVLSAPLQVIAGLVPLFGKIVGAGTGFVATLMGLAWSCMVIAFAWLRFRPLLGLTLLAVTAALFFLLFFKGRKRNVA